METLKNQTPIAAEKLDFLLQIDYLIEQMIKAQVPLEEGYERLLTLVLTRN